MSSDDIFIGIDFGSTYSRVGVWIDGRVEIISDSQGHKSIPSAVLLGDDEHLVGNFAKQQVTKNPINLIVGPKRLIGRKFHEPIV